MKSMKTLQKGLDDGTFEVRRTQKVIDCPVLDDRTYVTPTAMYYGIPHPRIELWYRTKQGSCFLAEGWLTLGDMNGELYPAKSDSRRLDTFDIIRYTVGSGEGQRIAVTVPITKMYQPRMRVAGQGPSNVQLRFGGDWLSDTLPRLTDADPKGYSPIRWMWDISVNQDPPYEAGTFRDIRAVDASQIAARNSVGNNESPWTRNMPLVGRAIPCTKDDDCVDRNGDHIYAGPNRFGPLSCNPGPDLGLVANPVPAGTRDANGDGKLTVDDVVLLREGGPRCDLQAVGFGQFCAPGIARCMLSTAGTNEAKVQSNGKDVGGLLGGYVCIPRSGGYCYFRCDSDAMNTSTTAAMTMRLTYPGPQMQKLEKNASYPFDSRCGSLPGFQCKNPTSGPPSQARVCLRNCAAGDPDAFNVLLCGKTVAVSMTLSDKEGNNFAFQDQDIMKGTVCKNTDLDSTAGCTWDPAYEPRDPNTKFVPGQP
jgi:hypothetical protein